MIIFINPSGLIKPALTTCGCQLLVRCFGGILHSDPQPEKCLARGPNGKCLGDISTWYPVAHILWHEYSVVGVIERATSFPCCVFWPITNIRFGVQLFLPMHVATSCLCAGAVQTPRRPEAPLPALIDCLPSGITFNRLLNQKRLQNRDPSPVHGLQGPLGRKINWNCQNGQQSSQNISAVSQPPWNPLIIPPTNCDTCTSDLHMCSFCPGTCSPAR